MKNFQFFFKGLNLFKQKSFDHALSYFKEQIKINPFHTLSYYFIGKIYFFKRNYSQAFKYFKICYEEDSSNLSYNLYIGKTLLALKEFERSIDFLTKIAKINSLANFYLALAYYNLNRFAESVSFFKKCPSILFEKKLFCISFSASLFNLANFHYTKNQIDEAKKLFLESIQINKNCYPSYFQIGLIFLSEERYDLSKEYFEFLNDAFPKNESVKLTLAYLYNLTNDLEKLENMLKSIKDKDFFPDISLINFKKLLAYTLYRRKKYKEAIPLIIQLVNNNQHDVNLLFCLAKSRFLTNDITRALNVFNLIFKTTQTNVSINNFYLLVLIEQQNYLKSHLMSKKFIKSRYFNDKTLLFYYYSTIFAGKPIDFNFYFRELKIIFRNNCMFLEATANYFLKNKQYEKSVFYFYRLHQLMPNDLNTLLKLIDLFELRNFTHQVLIHLEKMHKLNPTNEHIAFYYSYHLIKRSNFNEAIKILKNIEKDKEKSYYLLSEVYFKIKDNKKGFFFLKKTFDLNPLYLPTQFKSLIYFYKNNNFLQSVRLCKLIEYTNSSFKRVLIYESIIYCKKGRIDLAINRLEKYLIENKEKDNPYIKFMLSCCYYTYGMTEKSEKLILHLIKKNQLKAPYLVMLALCYKRKYKNTELKRIEYILTQKFGKSPSFLEYKSKYLTIDKSNNYKRKDIGVRIP